MVPVSTSATLLVRKDAPIVDVTLGGLKEPLIYLGEVIGIELPRIVQDVFAEDCFHVHSSIKLLAGGAGQDPTCSRGTSCQHLGDQLSSRACQYEVWVTNLAHLGRRSWPRGYWTL